MYCCGSLLLTIFKYAFILLYKFLLIIVLLIVFNVAKLMLQTSQEEDVIIFANICEIYYYDHEYICVYMLIYIVCCFSFILSRYTNVLMMLLFCILFEACLWNSNIPCFHCLQLIHFSD